MKIKEAFKIWKAGEAKVRKNPTKAAVDKFVDDPVLRKASILLGKHRICFNCGKKMTMGIDTISGKPSEYIWVCKCMPNLRLMIC